MSKGVIYITTTSVTGLIKIGKTRTEQFESRMTTLEQNGYWNVNGLKRYFAVEVDDYDEKERLLHTVFSKSQVATSELFALDKNLAKNMLEAFDGRIVYPKAEKKDTVPVIVKRRTSSPRLTFSMLNIPVGSILIFTGDGKYTVTVEDNDNHVSFQGKVLSLSAMAKFLFGKIGKVNKSGAYQGGIFFMYHGKTLVEIRKEKEKNG